MPAVGTSRTSKAEAVAAIQVSNIVHLSCSGIQLSNKPHQSHLCLGDRNLTILELMNTGLTEAFFAFLSACETAKGDQKHADEVVHLTATMLFASFKSVVATMW
jgi:CHAT domain-containing protein